ncbi:MAG: nucleotide sugar dehydrogenase [Phenylobacterium sp.]|uniref:nucleotide sugar dehydrogenase n=1 Tax=Phenylobacterium sp. TaxID=1871053 RepID=UPI0025EFD29F|nr:nucleotide sugar dehydrogenase [Phenylobacterium sp.]MBI1198466.1 nucleotide sugar dehydrogenase [Phenylobacterium sp.]
MRILIYGLGYVGLTAAGCLTKEGHVVTGIDVNEDKIREINSGICPITEPGLAELLSEARSQGRLSAAQAAGEELNKADLALVCVGTPSSPEGAHNMSFIAEVSRQIAVGLGRNREKPLTVVYRSTMRPGSIEELILPVFRSVLGADAARLVEIVYNPEFLREATAIKDYFAPPKIVVGTRDARPSANVEEMYKDIEAPRFHVGFREAEFTKFVDNTWHAVKVAFANEIGRICTMLDVDPATVHDIFVSDTKLNISAYYMRPGGAFGGSCLPKDVRALQHLASDVGANATLIDSVLRSNAAHKHFIYEHCVQDLAPNARILLVGLAFKRNSDDLRESPNVDLAGRLLRAGHRLDVFDESIDPAKLVGQNLGYAYAHLPNINELLVSREAAEKTAYDLVIDASGGAKELSLQAARTVNLQALTPKREAPALAAQ